MTHASTKTDRGYASLPIPFGWFAVSMSDEIERGHIRTVRYFGAELVIWRGEDGTLNAVDPYCPHLGAHLGVNSTVQGNDLQCAYHHWKFNGGGQVTHIPYNEHIPSQLKRGCLPTWPIQEKDGVVYVWNHPNNAAPKWELAGLPACPGGGAWVEAERHEWLIDIHVQEITENGQDYKHFNAVHGIQGPPEGDFKLEGWVRRNKVVAEMVTPRGPMTGIIDVMATGPGQSISEFIDVCHVVMAQEVSPIDAEHTHLRWQLYHPPGISEGKMRVTKARMRDLVKQVEQDIPIWNSKIYRAEPLLVKGDGPMLAYRRQYARFYDFGDGVPEDVAA
ncbi:MAG: Rieske 2Fe-2S domain-containing protein [Novosphingobium sp.]